MGGLARILVVVVVVVALATRPSLQQFGAELDGLAQRCRDNVGEQAAVDFINAPYQLMTCTKYEAMYAEIQSSLRENNLKRGLQSVCKRKDELQTCTDQWYQTVKRCLIGEEKKVSAIFYGLIKPMMDFICEHVDDIVAITKSTDEQRCVTDDLLHKFQPCYIKKIGICDPMELLKHFINSSATLDQECNKFDGLRQCAIATDGRCKDSIVFRLLNEAARKALGASICSQTGTDPQTGTAPQTAGGTVPQPLVLLILAARRTAPGLHPIRTQDCILRLLYSLSP